MEMFKNKKINFQKLQSFGFKKNNDIYSITKNIIDGEFLLTITVSSDGNLTTKMIEKSNGEIYTLHLVKDADGSFVGKIKEEYETLLTEIAEKCCEASIFKSPYTQKLINYFRNEYNDELEYLWKKFPDNAIVRRKDTKKWYAAILTVNKSKLGFDTEENVEILDIRADIQDVPELVKQHNIFPGYHMNKKHWITIILDGSYKLQDIYKLIDKSYNLAK